MSLLLKNYFGFILGLVFGSTVATLTTYNIFYNVDSLRNIEVIQKCLINSDLRSQDE